MNRGVGDRHSSLHNHLGALANHSPFNCLIWPHLFTNIIATGSLKPFLPYLTRLNTDVGLISMAQNLYIDMAGSRNYVPRSEINRVQPIQPLRSISSNERRDAKFSLQAPFKLDNTRQKGLISPMRAYCFTDRPVLLRTCVRQRVG